MITKLKLRDFRSVGELCYELTRFEVRVGRINSGYNDVPQATRALTTKD